MNQICELTGSTSRTVKKRLSESSINPVLEDKKTKYYSPKEALPAVYQLNKNDDNEDSDFVNPIREKAKLDRARRIQIEIQIDKERELLVPISDVTEKVSEEYTIVRQNLLSIPSAISQELAITVDPEAVNRLLKDSINDVLAGLSFDEKYGQS